MTTVPDDTSTADREPSDAELAGIDAEVRAELAARPKASAQRTGLVLLIGSVVGWCASLALSIDKMTLLKSPNVVLSCDVNPLISCGKFLETWQASTFGFPNMFIGLGGFAVIGTVGSLLLSGAKLPRWCEWATFVGVAFSFAFVHWLIATAIFEIHALCPWCLVVWGVSAPMFFVAVAYLTEAGVIAVRGVGRSVVRAWIPLSLAWITLVLLTIFIAFLPQWMAMFT